MLIATQYALTTAVQKTEENISSLRSLRSYASTKIRVNSWFNFFRVATNGCARLSVLETRPRQVALLMPPPQPTVTVLAKKIESPGLLTLSR